MTIRTKSKRWLEIQEMLESTSVSDDLMELPYLSQATYFQTCFKREIHQLSHLLHGYLRIFSYKWKEHSSTGLTHPWHYCPLALGHIVALTGNILLACII